MHIEVLLILLITSLACVSVGVYLMLRNLSMMTDAISHTILLGIVLGFFVSNTLDSPLIKVGGVLAGLFSTWFISVLKQTGKVSEDAAIGIVFPLFFGIAVILITLFASNVHLDLDSVLLGEVVFAPLYRMQLFGVSLPIALVWSSIGLLLNCLILTLLYKELKLSSFDATMATVSGFSIVILQYILMTLVSFTAVVAFDAVGSILVIALMIGPAMSARLIVDGLGEMLVASVIYALVTTFLGYQIAIYLDVSVAGMIATVIGLAFLITAFVAPRKGIITMFMHRQKNKKCFEEELLLLHLQTHEGTTSYAEEAGYASIYQHLGWSEKKFTAISQKLIVAELIENIENIFYLTNSGREHVQNISVRYGLLRVQGITK